MARTSWQDLLDAPAAPPPDASRRAASAAAEATRELPRSLDDVPELRELMAERRRLEETLAAFTGQGTRPADEGRDARRFPVPPPPGPDERMKLRRMDRMDERARDEERRAFEVESLRRRRDEAADEERRAALRRRAGEERVAASRDAWARHEQELLAARDQARDAARERGPALPGTDVLERAVRGAAALRGLVERVNRPARAEGQRRSGDRWGAARDAAREAARWAEEELGDTQAGRTLRTLREVLDPPEVRPLPDYTRTPGVDPMELRRLRALAALRDRRAEEQPAARRRETEPSMDRDGDADAQPRAESAPRRRDGDEASRGRREDGDEAPRARREDDGASRRERDPSAPRARDGDARPRTRPRAEDDGRRRPARSTEAPRRARDEDTRRRAGDDDPRRRGRDEDTPRRTGDDDTRRRTRDGDERPRRKRTDDDAPRRRRATAEV
jgi:hypothetical protein